MSDEDFDAIRAGELVSTMWLRLGTVIADELHKIAEADPAKAIQHACCAEACFWKATGDADTHDVKDVLALASAYGGDEK